MINLKDDLKRVIYFANAIIESPDNFPFGIEHPIYSMIKILTELKEEIINLENYNDKRQAEIVERIRQVAEFIKEDAPSSGIKAWAGLIAELAKHLIEKA